MDHCVATRPRGWGRVEGAHVRVCVAHGSFSGGGNIGHRFGCKTAHARCNLFCFGSPFGYRKRSPCWAPVLVTQVFTLVFYISANDGYRFRYSFWAHILVPILGTCFWVFCTFFCLFCTLFGLQHTFYWCRCPYASTATWLAQSTWFATWSRECIIPSNLDSTRILKPRHVPNMWANLCAHCYRPIALWKRLRTLCSSGTEAMHAPTLRYQSGDATSSCWMYVSREACISRATRHPLGMRALCGSSLRGKPYALCVGGVRRSSARVTACVHTRIHFIFGQGLRV